MDTHFQAGSFFTGGKHALCFTLAKMIQILPKEPPSSLSNSAVRKNHAV